MSSHFNYLFPCFLVAGWDEGCLTMRQGETSRLTIAGHKGYGPPGFPAWGYPLFHSCCIFWFMLYYILSICKFEMYTVSQKTSLTFLIVSSRKVI